MNKQYISEAFDQLNRMNKKDTTKKVIKESASQVKTNRRTLNESKADNLLDLLQENFQVNWKEHADAPVPFSNPKMINVYSFNHDEYEPLRDKWSEDNKTVGQCAITAFLVQDIFGGEVRGIEREDGNYHCYNVVAGKVFDLTSEQFGDEELVYADTDPIQSREEHFKREEKKERYEYLKNKLENRKE